MSPQELAEAQLTFLGSATLTDNYPALIIDDTSIEALKGLATPREVHLAMDFATNRRFRRDVFIRSDTPRTPDDAARALHETVHRLRARSIDLVEPHSRAARSDHVPAGFHRCAEVAAPGWLDDSGNCAECARKVR